MRISIQKLNGVNIVITLVLVCILTMLLFNETTEVVMCVATTFVGGLLGMFGRIIYENIPFKDKALERTICIVLPIISGVALGVVAQSNIGGFNELFLVLSTLLALGFGGACLISNFPLPDKDALYFGISLWIMSVIAMIVRLSIPEDYWHIWIGIIIVMTSLSGVLIKDYLAKKFRSNNAES